MTSRTRWVLLAVLLLAAVLAPRQGRAWGDEGHKIVALVADRVLAAQAPAVRAKVLEILATDKGNELTKTDIASEATFADVLRQKSPEAHFATSEWHLAQFDPVHPDVARDCFGRRPLPVGYPASHGPRENCVVDKVEQFSQELSTPGTSAGERLAAVQFLLNLVADLHQPLYVINHKDGNGACIGLLLPREKRPVRLSRYWDELLVVETLGANPEAAAAKLVAAITPAEMREWSEGGPSAWAQQTYVVAKSAAYALPPAPTEAKYSFPLGKEEKDPCGGPVPVYRVDAAYRTRAAAAMRSQLAKAGVRLAALLRHDLH